LDFHFECVFRVKSIGFYVTRVLGERQLPCLRPFRIYFQLSFVSGRCYKMHS
jgi:hypothetical protein